MIPNTFRLCDGKRGTPDLRNRFIVGSGDIYAKGSIGGNILHVHDFISDGHPHVVETGASMTEAPGIAGLSAESMITGTTETKDGRPPYYSLAYVMYDGRPI